MNIILNGESCELTGKVNITNLLETRGLANKRVAVEVNEEILPRSQFGQYRLQEGDRVEIVRAIGGG